MHMSDVNRDRGMTAEPDVATLPSHIEEALAAIALTQGRHERAARPIQRPVERATRRFARPGMVVALLAISGVWMLRRNGKRHYGPMARSASRASLIRLKRDGAASLGRTSMMHRAPRA